MSLNIMCLGLNYAFKALALSGKKVDKIGSLSFVPHSAWENVTAGRVVGNQKASW